MFIYSLFFEEKHEVVIISWHFVTLEFVEGEITSECQNCRKHVIWGFLGMRSSVVVSVFFENSKKAEWLKIRLARNNSGEGEITYEWKNCHKELRIEVFVHEKFGGDVSFFRKFLESRVAEIQLGENNFCIN